MILIETAKREITDLDPGTEQVFLVLDSLPPSQQAYDLNPRVYMPILNEVMKALRQSGKETTLPTILQETALFLEWYPTTPSGQFSLIKAIPSETIRLVEDRIRSIALFLGAKEHGIDMQHAY